MNNTIGHLRILSLGFWLPAGRSNFFDSVQDKKLIGEFNAYSPSRNPLVEDLTGYRWDDIPFDEGRRKLQSSIYYRLLSTLTSGLRTGTTNEKCYSSVFPIYSEPLDRINSEADPNAVIFLANGNDLIRTEIWKDTASYLKGLALLVDADGFYLWFALYDVGLDEQTEQEHQHQIRQALHRHIKDLSGGDFYNRSANRRDSPDYQENPSECTVTLQTYRDKNLGIFPFFQINLIFEGLYNYNLDPRVFFDDGEDPNQEIVTSVKAEYSLGKFIDTILTELTIAPPETDGTSNSIRSQDFTSQVLGDVIALFSLDSHMDAETYHDIVTRIVALGINPYVRSDILRQFMRKTSTETLHLLKWRIESCGSALLSIMIKIAHLRQPLAQTEIPDTPDKRVNAQARYNIAGANEEQLRGYVILLAAKLPLIETVWLYLQNNLAKLGEMAVDLTRSTSSTLPRGQSATGQTILGENAKKTISGLERSWKTLINAIKENITGLEQAIDQAYKNEMLAETQKLRVEQEILAEIERIRERNTNEFSPTANLTVNIIANVIAFAGVLAVLVFAGPQLQQFAPLLKNILQSGFLSISISILVALIGIVLVLIIPYFILHELADPFIRFYSKRRRQSKQGEELYYYEMDLRLDIPTTQLIAQSLIAGDFTGLIESADKQPSDMAFEQHGKPYVERGQRNNRQPKRNSYRVNRMGADEAIHKIYITASILWPKKRFSFTKQRMQVFLVYEVLFNKPSTHDLYVLASLRVVSTSQEILSSARLDALKLLIISEFINPLIPVKQQRLQSTDALIYLHPTNKMANGGLQQ